PRGPALLLRARAAGRRSGGQARRAPVPGGARGLGQRQVVAGHGGGGGPGGPGAAPPAGSRLPPPRAAPGGRGGRAPRARGRAAALSALGEPSAYRPAVLVVDQFEEVFTHCNDDGQRRAFFDRLLAPAPGRVVVVTMRADFWGDCAPYPALKDAMLAHQVLIA